MEKHSRRYLGVIVTTQNYKEILEKEGRDGINFHQKHLRAYLKGKKQFQHKFKRDEEGHILYDGYGLPMYNTFPVQFQNTTEIQ